MNKIKFYLLIISYPIIFFACDSNRLYEKNVDFEGNEWPANEIPDFTFEVKDVNRAYNIYYNVRNTISYPYQNLYVTYFLEDTLGNTLSSGLQNMLLFDRKTGEPFGSGLGDIFDHQVLSKGEYSFPEAGFYRFRIEQFMRTDTLPDILSVGVRIEKSE